MSEVEPFSDSCDDFELELLRSCRKDTPSVGAASKTLLALGLTAPHAAAAGLTGAAVGARSLALWSVVKGVGIGLLVGGAIMTVAVRPTPSHTKAPVFLVPAPASGHVPSLPGHSAARADNSEAPSASPTVRAAGPSAIAPAPARRADSPVLDADTSNGSALAALPSGVAAFATEPTSKASTGPSEASIADQVETIDRARRALQGGRASEALGLATVYTQRWPNGSLQLEAVIVRVEAELALGERAAAERDARGVIRALPGSRYAARLRQLFSPPLSE